MQTVVSPLPFPPPFFFLDIQTCDVDESIDSLNCESHGVQCILKDRDGDITAFLTPCVLQCTCFHWFVVLSLYDDIDSVVGDVKNAILFNFFPPP